MLPDTSDNFTCSSSYVSLFKGLLIRNLHATAKKADFFEKKKKKKQDVHDKC